ncbi:Kelch repeat-containing protein-like protein 6 [Colletotrichum plurivorum]|uniref:Kelch repeat-containing protein-like protein 6 n=1 Tax=Colletotrichum plurivorum TaxID=2175906 RepID=A0A8H6KH19_9PEZI|nr:Kelch repeat-containing protein-like protein 6 [Colletotrichum plurivorum]
MIILLIWRSTFIADPSSHTSAVNSISLRRLSRSSKMNSTLSIDLSRSWKSSNVEIRQIPKTAPKIERQVMLTDNASKPFYLWGGLVYSELSEQGNSKEIFPQGLGIFDLSRMVWKDEYDAAADKYESGDIIRSWHNAGGLETVTYNKDVASLLGLSAVGVKKAHPELAGRDAQCPAAGLGSQPAYAELDKRQWGDPDNVKYRMAP